MISILRYYRSVYNYIFDNIVVTTYAIRVLAYF